MEKEKVTCSAPDQNSEVSVVELLDEFKRQHGCPMCNKRADQMERILAILKE